MAKAWAARAAWTGYAKALQLQSAEIDEIDVFSWGCGLPLPHRPAIPSHLDLFGRFDEWHATLREDDRHYWRDRLPTAIGDPAEAADHPPLIRALDTLAFHHGDPFDHLILAQAERERLMVVTSDRQMALYGVPCIEAAK